MVVVFKCFAGPLGLQQIPQSFGTWTASFTGGIENLYAVAGAVEGMKSAWLTICSLGCSTRNHAGRCPQVMKWILRTHGANRSTPRNQ